MQVYKIIRSILTNDGLFSSALFGGFFLKVKISSILLRKVYFLFFPPIHWKLSTHWKSYSKLFVHHNCDSSGDKVRFLFYMSGQKPAHSSFLVLATIKYLMIFLIKQTFKAFSWMTGRLRCVSLLLNSTTGEMQPVIVASLVITFRKHSSRQHGRRSVKWLSFPKKMIVSGEVGLIQCRCRNGKWGDMFLGRRLWMCTDVLMRCLHLVLESDQCHIVMWFMTDAFWDFWGYLCCLCQSYEIFALVLFVLMLTASQRHAVRADLLPD